MFGTDFQTTGAASATSSLVQTTLYSRVRGFKSAQQRFLPTALPLFPAGPSTPGARSALVTSPRRMSRIRATPHSARANEKYFCERGEAISGVRGIIKTFFIHRGRPSFQGKGVHGAEWVIWIMLDGRVLLGFRPFSSSVVNIKVRVVMKFPEWTEKQILFKIIIWNAFVLVGMTQPTFWAKPFTLKYSRFHRLKKKLVSVFNQLSSRYLFFNPATPYDHAKLEFGNLSWETSRYDGVSEGR